MINNLICPNPAKSRAMAIKTAPSFGVNCGNDMGAKQLSFGCCWKQEWWLRKIRKWPSGRCAEVRPFGSAARKRLRSAGEDESIFLSARVARRNSISRRLPIGYSRRHSNCACTIVILSGHFERDSAGRCKFDFGRAVHKFTKIYCFDRFAFRSKSYYSRLKPMPIMGIAHLIVT